MPVLSRRAAPAFSLVVLALASPPFARAELPVAADPESAGVSAERVARLRAGVRRRSPSGRER